jgi:penicillin-binding protein 1A
VPQKDVYFRCDEYVYFRSGDDERPDKRKLKIFLRIFFVLFFVLFLTAASAIALMSTDYISDTPELSSDRFWMAATSHVYDRLGNEVAVLYGEQNRDYIELARIPLHVQQAFIAIEDERFYKHSGVDLKGNIRAFLVNLKERKVSQGASTITQQLVRNVFLTPERELKRKAQEMWLAVNLEKEYSKEEIFGMPIWLPIHRTWWFRFGWATTSKRGAD